MEEIIHNLILAYNMILSLPITFLLLWGAALSFIVMGCVQFYIWLTPERRKEFSDYFIPFQSLKNILYPDNTVILVFNLHNQYKFHELDGSSNYRMLNRQMSTFTSNLWKIVNQYNGIIKKNNKNNVIVIWNEYNYDDIDNCIISIINEIDKVNSILTSEKMPILQFGISLTNTISENIDAAIETTLQLESHTKTYNIQTIIDDSSVHLIDPKYILELDKVEYPYETNIYTLLNTKINEPEISKTQHEKFLKAYQQERYDMAISIGTSLKTAWNSILSNYYSAMINKCKINKMSIPK